MTPLSVNLKIFYQRKALWFWYVIILAQLPSVFLVYRGEVTGVSRMHYLIIPMLLGMLVGSLQKEIMTRPVTFCLPGGRRLRRNMIFGGGLIASLLLLLIPIQQVVYDGWHSVSVGGALVLINLGVYLFSAQFSFQVPGKMSWLGPVWALLFLAMFFGGYTQVWSLITQRPELLIGVFGLYVYYCWGFFDPERHARQFCGRALPGLTGNMENRALMRQQVAEIMARKKPDSGRAAWPERLTLAVMTGGPTGSLRRIAAGSVYSVTGNMMTQGLFRMMIPMGLLLLFYSYLGGSLQVGNSEMADFNHDIFFIIPVMGAMMWILPVHPSLHIPADRRRRYWASLLAMTAVTAVATGLVTTLVLLANLAEPWMPVVPWFGNQDAIFRAPELTRCYLTALLMPLGFTVGTLFGRRHLAMAFAGPILFLLAIGLRALQYFGHSPWYYTALCGGAFWLLFAAILCRHCLRGNLVGPGRE